MPKTVAVPISDLVSEYYWGFAGNNPVAEIVLSSDDVLKQHLNGLLKPLRGLCSIEDYIGTEDLMKQIMDLKLPPDAAKDHIRYIVHKMQIRAVTILGDLPLYTHWYCELEYLPGSFSLVFHGGTNGATSCHRPVRHTSSLPENQHTRERQSFTGPSVYGPVLSWMGNESVIRGRIQRRLERFSQQLSVTVSDESE